MTVNRSFYSSRSDSASFTSSKVGEEKSLKKVAVKKRQESKMSREVLILIAKVLLLFLLELIVPFGVTLLPILAFPYVVQFLYSGPKSKVGPLLQGMSALAAADDIYNAPLYSVLMFYFVEGDLDVETHRQLFRERVIEARDPKTRELVYPQLQSSITRVLGYSFWKSEANFSVEEHIGLGDSSVFKLAPGEPLDEKALAKTSNYFLSKPFKAEKSPWEVMIFSGAKSLECETPKQSLVVFRYHHALSDGYSITHLFSKITTGDVPRPLTKKYQVPIWLELLRFFAFPFIGTFVLVAYISKYVDRNRWRCKAVGRRNMNFYCSESMKVDTVKAAKDKLKTNFNAVVLAGLSGGIRKYFEKRDEEVPEQMHVGIAVPIPGHPGNALTNHWTAVIVNLHIDELNPVKRVRAIDQDLHSQETRVVSQITFLGSQWGGALPAWVIKLILKNVLHGSTGAMSIFPGPTNLRFLTGEKMVNGGFLLGPLETQGISITVISYNGRMRVFFGMEKALEDAGLGGEDLTEYIFQETKNIVDNCAKKVN